MTAAPYVVESIYRGVIDFVETHLFIGGQLRCDRCGSGGAKQLPLVLDDAAQATLCFEHALELRSELRRHLAVMSKLATTRPAEESG